MAELSRLVIASQPYVFSRFAATCMKLFGLNSHNTTLCHDNAHVNHGACCRTPNRAARHRSQVFVPCTDYTVLTNCFYMYTLQLWTFGLCFSPPHMSSDASSTCWIVDCRKAITGATADATQVSTIRLPGMSGIGVSSGSNLLSNNIRGSQVLNRQPAAS